jgi:hypothetical protein
MSSTAAPRLSGFLATTLPKIAFLLGALGLGATAFLWRINPQQVAFSYLFAFLVFLAMTLGSLFFVIIHHLVRAGWHVVLRRIPEAVSMNIGLMAILFIPIIFGMHHLYHWTHPDVVAVDTFLQGKAPYLNVKFFLVRAAVFFGAWIFIARFFYKRSVSQDTTPNSALTLAMQGFAAGAVLIYGVSQTFAVIDWAMSVTPHWYSTMFGVYFFAGSFLSAMALMSVTALILRRFGFLKDVIRTDHYHDIAKFVYGMNIFWAYVSFSQYFLIWYANIPEESTWFMEHFHGSWNSVGILLAVGHFGIPFIVFMSKHARRNLKVHGLVMCWFLIMQVVDMYWLILPNLWKAGVHISLSDITSFVGIGGLFVGMYWRRLSKTALYPVGDPRISDSLHHHT